ncbi:MAG TPA: HPF/RaiA family ribosome-associated protein [Burkholderiaceae bacterium]|nr:HPF/RaiA family ribosome-associated protein [Burkholderiaceae bacterium]
MQFQLNTDHNVRGSEDLAARLQADTEAALDRFTARITRVEMHLGDLNAAKSGADKRCQIEVRIAGRTPVSVHHVAPAVREAVDGALDKMSSALDHAFGKLDASKRGAPHHGLADGVAVDDAS